MEPMEVSTERHLIPGYEHRPGHHCGSTALRNLLAHHGVELSEEMAFGLGAGASFYYLVLEAASPTRWFNGRTAQLENNFLELSGAPLQLETFDEPDAAWDAARAKVDAGQPALLLTDLYYLDHYGKSAHFPGHAVVLAGYDDDNVYLSDTGFEELQVCRIESLREARHGDHPAFSLRGHMFTVSAEAEPERLRRVGGRGDRAGDEGDGRAELWPVRRAAGAAPGRGAGRALAAGRPRLAVVCALRLPGDRAPRDRRRQLPAHVRALPR